MTVTIWGKKGFDHYDLGDEEGFDENPTHEEV